MSVQTSTSGEQGIQYLFQFKTGVTGTQSILTILFISDILLSLLTPQFVLLIKINRAISLCAAGLSLLIIVLAIIALVEPWWVYCESIVHSVLIKRYQGFWIGCTDTNGNVTCSEIHGDDWNDWEKVTLAMMFLGIFLTVISFIMSIVPPRLLKVKMAGAGINILAGVLFLVGGSVFGAKGKGKKICSNPYLGSCFILGVLCLILLFINACVFAAATAIQGNRRSSVSIHQQILDVDVS